MSEKPKKMTMDRLAQLYCNAVEGIADFHEWAQANAKENPRDVGASREANKSTAQLMNAVKTGVESLSLVPHEEPEEDAREA